MPPADPPAMPDCSSGCGVTACTRRVTSTLSGSCADAARAYGVYLPLLTALNPDLQCNETTAPPVAAGTTELCLAGTLQSVAQHAFKVGC